MTGNTRHRFETFQMGNQTTWCKHCNCTYTENKRNHIDPLDRKTLYDFVAAHGVGAPTKLAYEVARMLLASGDDYATAASEIVARGLTK